HRIRKSAEPSDIGRSRRDRAAPRGRETIGRAAGGSRARQGRVSAEQLGEAGETGVERRDLMRSRALLRTEDLRGPVRTEQWRRDVAEEHDPVDRGSDEPAALQRAEARE